MRCAVFGAGSLGTVLGAYLSKANVPVDLISRNRDHIIALRKGGAHITGKAEFTVPVTAMLPEEMGAGYDIIILMTKCIENDATVRFLQPKLTQNGVLCTCQNGLPEYGIAEIIGKERTYGCTIGWGARYLSPGVVELTTDESTFTFSVGSLADGDQKKLEEIASIFSCMGQVEIEENFNGARWSKLLINASFSAVSALSGEPFGVVAENWRSRRIIQSIMKECVDVAMASGVKLAPMQGRNIALLADYSNPFKKFFSFMIIPIVMRKHRLTRSSMLQDIERGKPTEIDAIDGSLSEAGRRVGVQTPVTDRTIEIIHAISEGKLSPSLDNLALYRA
ncbi:MAG: 2-dehydropantoate 2-reductase [Spirochaetes bacterium]|uniref:2-dehydropantoate 2-reductase n=1 Tax=Candidatus Ornithospirochaeta stercoripullorum TaxID=2840899 RepID=A0A9D9H5M3_9SPIO|nr:2-dehydropantoate 2-reductase [Candidatus Ornithospirochaeta stercoripullorum]